MKASSPHVLQILPALNSGGVERGTIELASYLNERGIQSSVASSGGQLCASLGSLNTRHHQLSVDSKNPIKVIANAFRLARLIKDTNITLMHVRSRAPAWSTLLASRISGVPYIATFHGLYGHHNRLKRFYNSAMLRGKAVIAVSDFIAEHIQKTYPKYLKKTELTIINRGVDCAYFKPDKDNILQTPPIQTLAKTKPVKATTDKTQPDQKKPTLSLLLPGRFTRLKGHAFVLSAIERITSCEITLTMVGSSNDKDHYVDELEKQARHSRHQINFITEHQDLKALYAQNDVVISASTKPESFGRTVIEAQAMCCAVIAPDQGANTHIVCPELQLGLFTPNNEQSFTDAITRISKLNDAERISKTQHARAFILDNFQLQQMTQKTLELYQQLWQDDLSRNEHSS